MRWMKTSLSVGLLTLSDSISPGKASTTSGTKRCPFSISRRTGVVHDSGIDVKLVSNVVGQGLRVVRFHQNYVAADFAAEGRGRA